MSTELAHVDHSALATFEPAHPAPGSLEAITRSEIDMQISTAKRYPRSIARFRQNALTLATLDAETAASCGYALKRSGKLIEGPSIRLAEMVSVSWTNLRYGGRIIGEEHGFLVAQGFAHDMEANVAASVEVRRRITSSAGTRYNDDMIGVTAQAAISIAVRNAIFKVVPRALVDSIYRDAKKVATGEGNEKTVAQRRQAAVTYFTQKLGVPKEKLWAYLSSDGRSVGGLEDIGLPELELLQGLVTALKEGETTLEEAFGLEAKRSAASPLGGAAAPPPPTAAPAAAPVPGAPPQPPTKDAEFEPAAAPAAAAAAPAAPAPAATPEKPAEPDLEALLVADIRDTKSSAQLKAMAKMITAQPRALQQKVEPVYAEVMAAHKAAEAKAAKAREAAK